MNPMGYYVLPYPPTANLYWRNFRGRMVTSAAARAYKAKVAMTHTKAPVTGPVGVTLLVYRPARRGDLDNTLKVSLDSLKGIAFEDDSQIQEICARRYEDPANPRIEVKVWELM